MTQINQLTSLESLSGGDLLPIYSNSNSDARKVSIATLQSYLEENLSFAENNFREYVTQYSAPSATGFSVTITDGDEDNQNVHLILTPTAGFAAGTIVLPPFVGLADKQEVLVNCTQSVTTLTISLNGAGAVTGAPTTLAANAFFRLKYDQPLNAWYRIG